MEWSHSLSNRSLGNPVSPGVATKVCWCWVLSDLALIEFGVSGSIKMFPVQGDQRIDVELSGLHITDCTSVTQTRNIQQERFF